MTLNEFKYKLLDTGLFHKVSGDGQYRCDTCPFCGDNKKHLYVLIRFTDDTPVMYHCFKCLARGIINEKFLEFFGIEGLKIPKMKNGVRIHQTGSRSGPIELLSEETDSAVIQRAQDYIFKRVKYHASVDELKSFQLIGNPKQYVENYLGGKIRDVDNRIWFRLSNGNIIGRNIDDHGERWRKYNVVKTNQMCADYQYGTYMIRTGINTHELIKVFVCEGVMDCIGLHALNYLKGVDNCIIIGCMGRDYTLGIKHVLDMGIFGDSVHVHIMKDKDVEQVRIPNKYRLLFKSIDIKQNALGKDYGVPADCIEIENA